MQIACDTQAVTVKLHLKASIALPWLLFYQVVNLISQRLVLLIRVRIRAAVGVVSLVTNIYTIAIAALNLDCLFFRQGLKICFNERVLSSLKDRF